MPLRWRRLFATDAGAGALLVGATVVALVWANSPWSASYDRFWHTGFGVTLGDLDLTLDLRHWVIDGLMTVFFFVLGLELKRELVMGGLTDRKRAALPVLAALVGLAVPAGLYLLLNPSGEAAAAWGVVISTDTAFVLGVLALVTPGAGGQLRLFILTLAVIDDIGALLVIAVFYTSELSIPHLLGAVGCVVAIAWLNRRDVRSDVVYVVLVVAAWILAYASGVHPTLVGVTVALVVQAFPPRPATVREAGDAARAFRQSPTIEYARQAQRIIGQSMSAGDTLHARWEPWSAYVVLPLFALASAGIDISVDALSEAFTSPVMWGIVLGLTVGKPLAIVGTAVVAPRLGLGHFGEGIRLTDILGGGLLSGMGFTISLLIVDLALGDSAVAGPAVIGVLVASLVSAVLGATVLVAGGGEVHSPVPACLEEPVDPTRDHVRGPLDAPLTLVEYADFECPFCGVATGSVDEVLEELGDGVRYVFRHLPLSEVHPHAWRAAELAERAAEHGRFWEAHDLLFQLQQDLGGDALDRVAARLDLPPADSSDDPSDDSSDDPSDDPSEASSAEPDAVRPGDRWRARVQTDLDGASAGRVHSTPTFFVNGVRYRGQTDAQSIIAALRSTRSRHGVG